MGARARRGRAAASRGERPVVTALSGLRDGRAGLRTGEAAAAGPRLAHRRAPRGGLRRARRVPPAALGDRRRRSDRGAGRRARRRARADRRALAQARRRRGARVVYGWTRTRSAARERDPHLVGSGRPGRRTRRRAGAAARRERRVLPAGDGERARRLRRLGGGRGRRADEPRSDRAARRLGRRGGGQPGRARARRAGGARARDLDVPRARRGLGRPRPAGHELPRARRDVRQPGGPRAAAPPRRDPARARRARLDREARRALRRRASPYPSAVFAEVSASCVRRHPVRRGRRARGAAAGDRSGAEPTPSRRRDRARPGEAAARPLPRALLRAGRRARRRSCSSSGRRRRSSFRAGRARPWHPRRRRRHASARTARPSRSARAINSELRSGVVRIAERARGRPPAAVEVSR